MNAIAIGNDWNGIASNAIAIGNGNNNIMNSIAIGSDSYTPNVVNDPIIQLMYIVRRNKMPVEDQIKEIKSILDTGVNVNEQMLGGKTVLMYAVFAWDARKEVVEVLLDAGADVNLQTDDGKNALSLICNAFYGAEYLMLGNIMVMLLEAGSDYSRLGIEFTYKPVFQLYLQKKENKELKQHIESLKQQLEELTKERDLLQTQVDYQPGGPGYDEAEADYNKRLNE